MDWRLRHLKTQPNLQSARFQRMDYRQYRPGWGDDHCAACSAKFAEFEVPNEPTKHQGYSTSADDQLGAEYDWVCLECFAIFKAEMGWTEIENSN
jgi:hypothetical protein